MVKVSDKMLMKYAKSIKEECKNRTECKGCVFCSPNEFFFGCRLWQEGEAPEFWDLEEDANE